MNQDTRAEVVTHLDDCTVIVRHKNIYMAHDAARRIRALSADEERTPPPSCATCGAALDVMGECMSVRMHAADVEREPAAPTPRPTTTIYESRSEYAQGGTPQSPVEPAGPSGSRLYVHPAAAVEIGESDQVVVTQPAPPPEPACSVGMPITCKEVMAEKDAELAALCEQLAEARAVLSYVSETLDKANGAYPVDKAAERAASELAALREQKAKALEQVTELSRMVAERDQDILSVRAKLEEAEREIERMNAKISSINGRPKRQRWEELKTRADAAEKRIEELRAAWEVMKQPGSPATAAAFMRLDLALTRRDGENKEGA